MINKITEMVIIRAAMRNKLISLIKITNLTITIKSSIGIFRILKLLGIKLKQGGLKWEVIRILIKIEQVPSIIDLKKLEYK